MVLYKKTPAILVATHGDFCTELIHSAEMIYGKREDVIALPLKIGMSPDDYESEMDGIIERYDGDLIILVDIISGTPFNTVMKLGRKRPLSAVAGVNLMMLFQVLDDREMEREGEKLAASAVDCAKESVRDITPNLQKYYELAKKMENNKE